ncbi:MAG: hypothetical protein PSX37_05845 [bacterium]|nr:hypothetical protein [bacterium]
MTSHRTAVHLLIATLTVSILSGCGVQLQPEAIPIPGSVIPSPLRIPVPDSSPVPVSAATEQVASRLRLWFVQEDGLAAAESQLPTGTPPDLIIRALVVGPDATQAVEGLRTVAADPLTGIPFISADQTPVEPAASPSATAALDDSLAPTPSADWVTVRLNSAFTSLPPGEQVLLLGQVVLSLSGAGARAVAFTDEAGTALAVPLPDGRLLDVPATARDYASLIIRP